MAVMVFAYAAFANPSLVQERVYKFATEGPAQLGLVFMDVQPQGIDVAVAALIAQLEGKSVTRAVLQGGLNHLLARALASGKYNGKVQVKVIAMTNSIYQVGMFASATVYAQSKGGVGANVGGVQSEMLGHAVVASTVAFSVFTTAIFFITDITLGLFAALLPLFIVVYFFGKIGKGMMQAWLKVIISLIFTKLFACVVLGVCFQLLVIIPGLALMVTGKQAVLGIAYYNPIFALISTLWLCIFFLKQVPSYASAIAGVSVMSMYELGHSMSHAGVGGETGLGKPPGGGKKPPSKPNHPNQGGGAA